MTVYTSSRDLVRDFVSRGIVLLHPDNLGVDRGLHEEIYEKEKSLFRAKQSISAENLPEILKVLNAPGLVSACDLLLGEDWAIFPFTHNTPFVSGARDQHWHKDDNGPYNGRRPRYHQPIQIEMLYYPQAVEQDMGPTATLPFSQYWTFDHEENQDNFAGADHLDFAYQIEGWERVAVSGKGSGYDLADIRDRKTAHDVRMREAVSGLNWPMVAPDEAAPIEAGTVLIYSHNLFHRGNHRRDDWQIWQERPRFMWRFWLYRTKDAALSEYPDFAPFDPEPHVATVWHSVSAWMRREVSTTSPPIATAQNDLWLPGEEHEPRRVGAAYALANLGEFESLTQGLMSERESVRRAATYGLVSAGPKAADIFLQASHSASKWHRKAGIFGLGAAASPSTEVIDRLRDRLLNDQSVYVRSVAADGLAGLARRAHATEVLNRIVVALLESLAHETNRLSMDKAQKRSIKFVRPTDECDVCEGIGITLGHERYAPVRSAVRENALVSLVVCIAQDIKLDPETAEQCAQQLFEIAGSDRNLFAAGLAMDGLMRLVGAEDERLSRLLQAQPTLCWYSLQRAGLSHPILG